MKPKKPYKTESTFATNKEISKNAGASDIKRDGKLKDINIALYDIDYAIKWQLENVIKPTVVEDNSILNVPIMFAAGEKWAAIQKHGYLRDNHGKILTPMLMIKRNGVSKRDDIQDLKVLESADARIIFKRQYSKVNRYDRFSLTNRTPETEYYSVDVPKFVQVDYEILCWTNNTIQLNEMVEQLIWFDGKAFGDAHKFITYIDPPSFEQINSTGEDRIVRATLGMRTKAYILNTHGPNAPSMYKINPVTRVVMGIEVDSSIETGALASPSIIVSSAGVSGVANSMGGSAAVLAYLNANKQLTGTVLNNTIVSFASGWISSPGGLTQTSIDNFVFYVNGVLLERSAIVSFTQSSGSSTLLINSTNLGYTLDVTDEVIGIGKFLNQDPLA